jgi:hypothetical protein
MVKCSRCGVGTNLYVKGQPLCIECDRGESQRLKRKEPEAATLPPSLTGKTFRLSSETLALETIGSRRQTVMIPPGALVRVMSGPKADDPRMLDLLWRGRKVTAFSEDVQNRGEEISAQSA